MEYNFRSGEREESELETWMKCKRQLDETLGEGGRAEGRRAERRGG